MLRNIRTLKGINLCFLGNTCLDIKDCHLLGDTDKDEGVCYKILVDRVVTFAMPFLKTILNVRISGKVRPEQKTMSHRIFDSRSGLDSPICGFS